MEEKSITRKDINIGRLEGKMDLVQEMLAEIRTEIKNTDFRLDKLESHAQYVRGGFGVVVAVTTFLVAAFKGLL